MTDKKMAFWNTRAEFGDKAGTDDLPLKNIEMRVLSEYIHDGQNVLDIGCGNGLTAFHLLDRAKINITGIDFAEKMIIDAKKKLSDLGPDMKALTFAVGDVCNLPKIPIVSGGKYDVIITERVLINLSSWKEQEGAIRDIINLLSPNGVYLMCENLTEGLNNINRVRMDLGLPEIQRPWHNCYLNEKEVLGIDFAELVEYRDFTSAYYFLSRVVNAWVAKKNNAEPQYNSDINQVSSHLIGNRNFESMGLGQTRLWVWRRKS
jgi:ubiquinone/menaquinone biosynthesis C-methylase UbiE